MRRRQRIQAEGQRGDSSRELGNGSPGGCGRALRGLRTWTRLVWPVTLLYRSMVGLR